MNDYSINSREENKDKMKSGIITAIIWSALLLFVFLYKFTEIIPAKKEVVTQMLINFGDNRNGNGSEEPANQEGSLASTAAVEENIPEEAPKVPEIVVTEKVLTGSNTKASVPKAEKVTTNAKTPAKSTPTKSNTAKPSATKTATPNSKTGTGDGKGTAAIGNLLKGRGTKPGSQGTNGTTGNAGDPLGGDGNGDSKVGIDRRLVGFIPGTMGRGGAQPSHSCSASGTISISYTVDKAGNVVSARRLSGTSDACIVTNSVAWVKRYVKAEKANSSSTGVYSITF